jgi:hypothetical protein
MRERIHFTAGATMRLLKFVALFTLASIPLILLKKKSDHALHELSAGGQGTHSRFLLTALPLDSDEIFAYDLRPE